METEQGCRPDWPVKLISSCPFCHNHILKRNIRHMMTVLLTHSS